MAVQKLSAITAAPGPPLPTDRVVGVTAANADVLYTAAQLTSGLVFPPPATTNLVFYVATTGSDSNPGTSVGLPFATIQHAVNVATSFDYLNQFAPVINIAAGTYTPAATPIFLAELINASTKGTIQGASAATTKIVDVNFGGIFRVAGVHSRWNVVDLTLDSPNFCFDVSFGTVEIFNTLDLGDSTSNNSCAVFLLEDIGNITSPGVTINLINNFIGQFAAHSGPNGILNFQSPVINLAAAPAGAIFTNAWIEIFFAGAGGASYTFTGVTYTNFAQWKGGQVVLKGAGDIVTVATDNGVLTDLPGDPARTIADNTTLIVGINAGINGLFLNNFPRIPLAADIPLGTFGAYKDTAGGGVYMACNDGGVVKKVALV